MRAKRLLIGGTVQNVGFRDWMVTKANALGVVGWVRNTRDGRVEALVYGDTPSVEELLRQCRRGPPMADVTTIDEEMADPPAEPGFSRWPTG